MTRFAKTPSNLPSKRLGLSLTRFPPSHPSQPRFFLNEVSYAKLAYARSVFAPLPTQTPLSAATNFSRIPTRVWEISANIKDRALKPSKHRRRNTERKERVRNGEGFGKDASKTPRKAQQSLESPNRTQTARVTLRKQLNSSVLRQNTSRLPSQTMGGEGVRQMGRG